MKAKVVLIGAGKHAILLAEKIIDDPKLELYGFIDRENVKLPEFILRQGFSILGDDDAIPKYKNQARFHLALGANLQDIRLRLIGRIQQYGLKTISIIHATSFISPSAILGRSVAVLINTVVHTNAIVGDFSCVNTGAIVEHDCKIGSNVFIQPNCVLAGRVTVGDNSVIGMGTSVREKIKIGKNCLIGGSSFVCRDIPDNSFALGSPARVIRRT